MESTLHGFHLDANTVTTALVWLWTGIVAMVGGVRGVRRIFHSCIRVWQAHNSRQQAKDDARETAQASARDRQEKQNADLLAIFIRQSQEDRAESKQLREVMNNELHQIKMLLGEIMQGVGSNKQKLDQFEARAVIVTEAAKTITGITRNIVSDTTGRDIVDSSQETLVNLTEASTDDGV